MVPNDSSKVRVTRRVYISIHTWIDLVIVFQIDPSSIFQIDRSFIDENNIIIIIINNSI
jgi:hypothetical protein